MRMTPPLLSVLLCGVVLAGGGERCGRPAEADTTGVEEATVEITVPESGVVVVPGDQPVIQMAILLDTSGSMSGLIQQAKIALWKIVNEFITARQDGQRPMLSVALYEYGNSRLEAEGGWIRQILPLTDDLDRVSQELFALTTNGGIYRRNIGPSGRRMCGWRFGEWMLQWGRWSRGKMPGRTTITRRFTRPPAPIPIC